MITAALELAAAGYRVFPVRPGDKRPPLVKGGFYAATTNPAQIHYWWRKWPDANIAARTGDGLAVVDVDPRNGGTLEAVDALGLPRDTRSVRTPAGGWQFHYTVGAAVVSRNGALAAGVDVKAERGYVLLPPSRRSDGDYTWLGGLGTPPICADAAVLNQVNVAQLGASGRPITARERKRPENVREGERHEQLVLWTAWFFRQYDPDDAESLAWQYNGRLAAPLPDEEVAGIINWANQKAGAARDVERWVEEQPPVPALVVTPGARVSADLAARRAA
jgi:Bifunctional DNA primase/polymerase, N-terminal